MDIKLDETPGRGSLYMGKFDHKVAELQWKIHENYIEADSTEVDDSIKGQGYGRKLFEELIRHARDRKLKIKPVCPFVVMMFKRHPEDHDVLYKD
ncbi:MAG: GNAT family N-acetyltransferase [Lentimicrobium sp.]|jgi:predicted GNAT family acetyltransferase|nr:GNAT family N-acetyltransferase [Lentimicrobium sp.]